MRRQLALVVLASASVLLLAFVVPLVLLVRTVAESQAVTAAQQDAQALAAVVASAAEPEVALVVQQLDSRSDRQVTVVLPDGRQVGAPVDAGASVALARSGRAFTARLDDGVELLAPVQSPAGTAVVRLLVPDEVLSRGVPQAVTVLLVLAAVLLAVTVAVADRLAQAVVRPLAVLAVTARRLSTGDLSARTEPGGPPEVVEVAGALDQLAERISVLLQAEREGIADLSHRLRTPLTALRLDAEALGDARESARVQAHADALEQLVSEVIREARRGVAEPGAAGCDAVAVTRQRAAFWSALADDQQRPFAVETTVPEAPVALSAVELSAALDVLLGNVVTHTPEGTAFSLQVHAAHDDGAFLVSVEDDGPGLPDAAVLERGRSGGGSTGLGLDIARRAAVAAGGRLVTGRSGSGGARVVLVLPAARRAGVR